jgi:hypothetical protein
VFLNEQNSDDNINLVDIDLNSQRSITVSWKIKNNSNTDWNFMANMISDDMRNSVFSETKSFNLHCVMVLPTQIKTKV